MSRAPARPRSGRAGNSASRGSRTFHGVPVSDGLASGTAHLVLPEEIPTEDRPLAPGDEVEEVRRFRGAVRRARDEIQALRECLVDADEAGLRVLDAHLTLLEDQELLKSVVASIRNDRRSATSALRAVFQRMISALEAAGTDYFRARSADIRDVRRRILRHLDGRRGESSHVPDGSVIIAPELSPSESAVLDPTRVRAMVTGHGGATSHAAILARSRGIPAVAGLVDLTQHVAPGDWVLVDGHRGEVTVRPTEAERKRFAARERELRRHSRLIGREQTEPAVTLDGHAVKLLANIESPHDLAHVLSAGADGIGLYRTEYFYLAGSDLPDEEGQYRAYRQVLRRLRPRPVTIRTLDVGGDKFASYLGTSRPDNPFLGVRGIRFLLLHRDVLRTQLRAILRAAPHGNARILFPMVSSVDELREVNQLLVETADELRREGFELAESVPRGIMIEVPSAVTLADLLARETDFFSIGSNDLIQYTLAVDRGDEKVAHLYDPFHPAVLRAIAATIDAARRAGIAVTSCGEMSGDLYGAALLIGLGCTSLSMSAPRVLEVKHLIRKVRLVDLRGTAEEALRQPTGRDVRRALARGLSALIGNGGPEPLPAAPRAGSVRGGADG